MNQIKKDLLELHAKFHKWVRNSKHDYCLAVRPEDSFAYVQADTQGAFDAFCAGMVASMEDYEQSVRETILKGEGYILEDFKRKKCNINGLNHQRLRTVFGIDALNHKVASVDQSSNSSEVRQNVFGVIQQDRKGVYLECISEPGIFGPISGQNSVSNKPVLVISEARTESQEKALDLYRVHLNEFLTTKHPEPFFRIHDIGGRFYASLDEAQKLYILNKFVAGTFKLTTYIELENKFIEHFGHMYRTEENIKKVRQIPGFEQLPLAKKG